MAKKNTTIILKITAIVIVLVIAAAGIVYSYGILNDNVRDNTEAIKEQKDEVAFCNDINIRQDKDVIEIKSDLRHLKEDVGEIKYDMKQQTTILEEIRREVQK